MRRSPIFYKIGDSKVFHVTWSLQTPLREPIVDPATTFNKLGDLITLYSPLIQLKSF